MKKFIVLVFALVFFFVQSVSADIIHLKNGNTYEGQIVKEDDEKVAVKTTIMTVILSKDEIKAIQRDYPSLDSRLAAGETFDIEDVLKDDGQETGIEVIKKEE
jgi:hypothetical protein